MSSQADNKDVIKASMAEMYEVIAETVENGGSFPLITAGYSMKPLLRHRCDTVFLVKSKGRLSLFDIPLYRRKDGSFVLHRVVKVKDECYHMCGDNQTLIEKNVSDDCIIAVVEKIKRKGKIIDLSSCFGYKLYVFFWCRCFFIRFCILKLRNLVYKIIKK